MGGTIYVSTADLCVDCRLTGRQAAIDAQQASAVVANQLDLVDNFGNGVLFLDLLVHKPVQDGAGVQVLNFVSDADDLADVLGDLLLVSVRCLESIEWGGCLQGRHGAVTELNAVAASQQVASELLSVLTLFF